MVAATGLAALWLFAALPLHAEPAAGAGDEIRLVLGVLAHRGDAVARERWTPFVDYLTEQVDGARFDMVPVDNDGMQAAVADGRFDLILTNGGSYVMLEQRHGIARIATIQPTQVGRAEGRFGAVVIARAERDDLVELGDLRGQRLSAVHPDAFGGWWMTWRELQAAGVDVEADLAALRFTGFPVRSGLDWVLNGKVDAATFRTGILEDLERRGDPRVERVRVVGERSYPAYANRVSTRLYPEWPLAMRGDLDAGVARATLLATLSLDAEHPVSQAAGIAGWAAPRSYEEVHSLMHELGVGLYAPPPFDILVWLREHLVWLVSVLAGLALVALFYVSRMHGRVRMAVRNLERSLDAIPDAVVTLDSRGRVAYLNPAARELVGLSRDQALGWAVDRWLDLRDLHSDAPLLPAGAGDGTLERALNSRAEARLARTDGQELVVRVARTPLDPVAGSSVRTLLVMTDVSEERRLVDRLAHEASHDGLTGLLNRRAFEKEMEAAMHAAREHGAVASLLLVDLDYFKDVNDRHGHRVGDEVLRLVARILGRLTRTQDVVARIGGDEFAVIAGDSGADTARVLAQRICSALSDAPLQVEATEVIIGASVGVVELGPDAPSVDAVFVAADRACYQAKNLGRGQVGVARKADLHALAGV